MLPPQTLLQGRYRILRSLGAGGMGTVYEAVDLRLDCLVALKESTVTGDEAGRAFQREAKLLANLRHRALPNVMDHFSEADGLFLVMEFIPGEDLGKLLQRRGRFEVEEILGWTEVLLKTLEYLHGRNPPILHRDIKPANLKLTDDDELFLLDFGLAKGSVGQMQTMLKTVSVLGHTPVYAPVEQVLATGTDERSDLYSLGATIYHLISGTAPIEARMRFNANENEQPDPLVPVHPLNPKISKGISDVISKSMSISRRDRYASATAMRVALRTAVDAVRHQSETTTKPFPGSAAHPGGQKDETSLDVSKNQQWDEPSFLKDLAERRGGEEAEVAKRILNWCEAKFSRIRWGSGKQDGSFSPVLVWHSNLFIPIVVYTYGRVEIQLQHMKAPPFHNESFRTKLLHRLNQIPGVRLPEDSIKRRPSIQLSSLKSHEALRLLFETLAWAIDEVKLANHSGFPNTLRIHDEWNGEFYVSFGESETRSWADAVDYGFISAGGGRWYWQTLQQLAPGDRIWVRVPGYGFVGVGIVKGHMQPAGSFEVETAQGKVPVLDVAKRGLYQRNQIDNPDLCEYFVPVDWLHTVPLREAIHETGMFGNQNTACKPTTPAWRSTVERLKRVFQIDDRGPVPNLDNKKRMGQDPTPRKKSRARPAITEEELFKELVDTSPVVAKVARKILDWSRSEFSRVEWKASSFVPVLEYGSKHSHNPITVFGRGKVARVGIKFGRMKKKNGMSDVQRLALLHRLNQIPGVNLPIDRIGKYPNILLSTLAEGDAVEQFKEAIAWTNEQVKAMKTTRIN